MPSTSCLRKVALSSHQGNSTKNLASDASSRPSRAATRPRLSLIALRVRFFHGSMGVMAPSQRLLEVSIKRSMSSWRAVPRPRHVLHQPCGLLKLKNWGPGGGKPIPQRPHAYLLEKANEGPSSMATTTAPPPTFKAESTASVRRIFSLVESVKRSITTSISCFTLRSRFRSSPRLINWPSTRALRKPCRIMSSRIS